MKLPRQLTKRQLVKIVEEIRDILYMSEDTYNNIANSYVRARTAHFANKLAKEQPKRLLPGSSGLLDFLNPDKEWDAETISDVQQALDRRGLCPTRLMTPNEAYRKPTSEENWRDNAVQFPRLLNELDCLVIVDLLDAADQTGTGMKALEKSMDLPREKILEIFDRAQKEWDRIKKETR
jgi:hypothetical protein